MAPTKAKAPKRCLYEILEIERTATADEIRAAYRKLALKLHPDKAIHSGVSQEAATAQFQEILRAYEVLSDPHERCWYDSHRSQILHSSAASSSSAKGCDFDINLWPYFCTSVYSGYGDTGKGFFRVYGDLFQTLFQQEVACAHEMGTGPVPEAPPFGDLNSPYAQVAAFYNYWLGFSTVKDFSWVDVYTDMVGLNRRTRRQMEEDNKKLRKKAKREYNETVRQLAEFVKKRDRRVFERQVQRKREEEEKKAAEAKLRRDKLEKEKLVKARQYEEQQEWARIGEGEGEEEDDDEDDGWYDHDVKGKKGSQTDGNRELYCFVCCKKFKSDKQWKNHEQSKKHRDRVMELSVVFKEDTFLHDLGINAEDTLLEGILERVDERLDSDAPIQGINKDTRAHVDLEIKEGSRKGKSFDFEEKDKKTSKNKVAQDFSVTEEFERSITGLEHFDDLNDNSSHKSVVADEEEEIENSDMDDETRMLEAMLKTFTAKRGANNM